MEEEIIETTEEETFDYNKLRYILNKDGYVCHASLGASIVCNLGECTEYNGDVPNGYSTIEEWYEKEIDKLNAWKIVDGNLVYDENKDKELQRQFEIENEENSTATHKWVRNQLGKNSSVVVDEFSNEATGTSLIVLEDSGAYEIPKLTINQSTAMQSETEEVVNIIVSNKNVLGIDAVSSTKNGVETTINSDGSIKLNGTAQSKNKFNKNTIRAGYRLSNDENLSLYLDSNFFLTDYIPVKSNTKYTANVPFTNLYNRIGFYDNDKNIIDRNDGGGVYTITTPENASYIRFGKENQYLDTFMLVEGTEIPEYEPYQSTIEFPLKGTSDNTDMLFLIKENLNYIVSGLVGGTYIDLYNYDGTNRTLVNSSSNGSINLSNSYKITQSVLKIDVGTILENVVIYPQIEIDDEANSFIKHEENKATAIIENGSAEIDTLYSYSGTTVLMADLDVELNVDYFKYKSLDEKFAEIVVTEESIKSQVSETITNVNDLQEKIGTIQSTILEQTNEAFTMWFEQTGLQNTLDTVQNELNNNTADNNTLKEYIHFEGAEITLGKSDSQTKLVIRNDRISFMTGETESAYISENTLYITDSTILNKLQIGHWETIEDDYGNLNTKWVGDN